MRLFGLKACDTCRKATKAIAATGRDVQMVDVRETPLAAADLARFHAAFGEDLVNRRSTTWRGLDEAARARPALELLAEHPALMKRPVIDTGDGLFLGWGPDVQAQVIG
ncbi:arsenate reductase family protein [Actibacterium sp. XHP0104]|uniref:arsenate reductase family protein n=1 Tax=Actibacterium sp. XHP0104 TaxID=2984335 RepID=UPI0021E80562|nr:ArsC/Spx/MgsR family protein [Actibacterium sp. XHP0104]MCV2881282.1 arsenate reductase [Actibacterium sp. XHP0104]